MPFEGTPKTFLAIRIHEFTDSPFICCKNITVNGTLFHEGTVFVRSHEKPETVPVKNARQMADLLELAADKRAERFLARAKRVGMPLATTSDPERFDAELPTLTDIPDEISRGSYWRIVIHPDTYQPELIAPIANCLDVIQKAWVQLDGWSFPFIGMSGQRAVIRANWIEDGVGFGPAEYWRFYQSGQFIHLSELRENSPSVKARLDGEF